MNRVEPNRNVYVGHRYVPLLVGEWDKSIQYEGLSIVTFKGNSYTSKKMTPPGIDIENGEYWVLTGNYNAQIEYYRQETERVSDELEKKADKSELETFKNTTNSDIENFKASTNSDINDFKNETNSDIEDFKNTTNSNYETLKNTTKSDIEYFKDSTNSDIENFKNTTNSNYENFTSNINEENNTFKTDVNELLIERSVSRGYDLKLDLNIDTTGATDVSDIFRNALKPDTTYFFPEGEYLFESRVEIPDNVKIVGDKAVINGGGFILKGENTTVESMIFKGHRNEGMEADVAIRMDSPINNTLINNTFDHARLYFNDFHPDYLQGNVKIINNTMFGDYGIFSGTSRPITIHSVDGLFIRGNHFDCRCPGNSIVKLQGRYETASNGNNYIGYKYTKNAVVNGNVFKGTGESCISLYDGAGEIVISDNIFHFGTKNEPAYRIIDGKNNGTNVITNKIRNIVISDNVYEGYYSRGGIRIQGSYGFQEEGDDQVGIISNNVITNYYEMGLVHYHIEISGFHEGIIQSNIVNHFTGENTNSVIVIGGVKTSNISNNVIKEGTILIANDVLTTSSDAFIGKIERVNISNNTIERFLSGAVYIRAVNNPDVDIIINGNLFNSNKGSPGQAHPVMAKLTPNIGNMVMTGNLGININSEPGSKPDLREPTINKIVEAGNSWDASILS